MNKSIDYAKIMDTSLHALHVLGFYNDHILIDGLEFNTRHIWSTLDNFVSVEIKCGGYTKTFKMYDGVTLLCCIRNISKMMNIIEIELFVGL